MRKSFVLTGAIIGFLAVALGAFGAHTLKEQLHMEPHWVEIWEKGVQYQMAHALALLFLGLAADRFTVARSLPLWTGRLFTVGTAIFSGSLYILALTSLSPAGPIKILGLVTPFGGVCFLVGWALLAVAAYREA